MTMPVGSYCGRCRMQVDNYREHADLYHPDPSLQVTYTELAGLTPPEQGSVISILGLGHDGPLFRVTNQPEVDDRGSFTLSLEPVD